MSVGNEKLLTPDDDCLHAAPDDNWWWHETCWFWFFVPERNVGGWLYNYVRPNAGVSGGGCFTSDGWAAPVRGQPLEIEQPAPGLGQHTDEILGELSRDVAEIKALREKGAV